MTGVFEGLKKFQVWLLFLASAGIVLATQVDAANSIEIKNTFLLVGSAGLLCCGLFRAGVEGLVSPAKRLLAVLVAPLMWLGLSALTSPARPMALQVWLVWVLHALLFVSLFWLFNDRQVLRRFLALVVLLGLVAGLRGFLQFFGWDPSAWQAVERQAFGRRVPACFGNPNFFAGFLVLMLPLALLQSFRGRGWLRGLGLASLVCGLWCLLFTGSKAGLLALVLQFFTFGHLVWHAQWPAQERQKFLKRWALAGLAGAVLAAFSLPADVLARFQALLNFHNESVLFRLHTWGGTWHMLLRRPLLGWGPGTWSLFYPQFRPAAAMQMQVQHSYEATHAENWLLQMGAESGLIGLLLFLALLVFILWLAWKRAQESRAAQDESFLCLCLFLGPLGSLTINLAGLDLFLPSSSWFFTAEMAALASLLKPGGVRQQALGRVKFWLGGAICLFLLAVLGYQGLQRLRANQQLRVAEALCNAGQYSQAIPLYLSCLREDPFNLEALYFLGSAFLDRGQAGDLEAAQQSFKSLAELAPDYVLLHDKLARLYTRQGKLDQALAQWQRQRDLDPYYLPAYEEAAALLFRRGSLEQAAQVLQQGLQHFPQQPGLANNFGILLVQQGRLAEAADWFGKLVGAQPGNVDARYNLAVVLWKQGKAAQARQKAQEVLKLQPGHEGARRLLRQLR